MRGQSRGSVRALWPAVSRIRRNPLPHRKYAARDCYAVRRSTRHPVRAAVNDAARFPLPCTADLCRADGRLIVVTALQTPDKPMIATATSCRVALVVCNLESASAVRHTVPQCNSNIPTSDAHHPDGRLIRLLVPLIIQPVNAR